MYTTAKQKLHFPFPLVELPGVQILSHLHCSPSPFSVALQSSSPVFSPVSSISMLLRTLTQPSEMSPTHPLFPGFLCDLWYSPCSASLFTGALHLSSFWTRTCSAFFQSPSTIKVQPSCLKQGESFTLVSYLLQSDTKKIPVADMI